MKGEPETGEATGRTTATSDTLFVEMPLGGFTADELQRAGGVIEIGLHGRIDLGGDGVGDEAVVDGDDGDACSEALIEEVWTGLVTIHPAAAVDEEKQRPWLVGLGLVEAQHLPFMLAIRDIGLGGFRLSVQR